MRKMIGVAICFLLVFPLCVSAYTAADGTLMLAERELFTLENDAAYQFILLPANSDFTISAGKTLTISDGGSMSLTGGRIRLKSGASWVGSNVYLNESAAASVTMEKGAAIDISFANESYAVAFSGLLSGNKIECARYGSRIVAPCPHKSVVQKNICLDCGHIYPEAVSPAGSALSDGNMTIIVGVACLSVGLLGGLLIGKRKEPAASGRAGTEKDD